jgi:LmbE family N-acetylglucosaminyl deacetylase
MRRLLIFSAALLLAAAPAQDSGHAALGVALRKLNVSGTFMQTAAHPDDETNALHAQFGLGMGLRSIIVQTTRGEGGQNEIGPELFGDMGVLRTSELLAAHKIDGAEQYFTRAIDFGYSFDPNEVIGKWGRAEIVGDFVRLIRTLRPDVLQTMNMQGRGGDRAHEATTVLTREAYEAAGDPTKYPEQIKEGLRPWRPLKLYFAANVQPPGGRGGPAPATPPAPQPKLVTANTNVYDPLLCRTYSEIGTEARANHKCQGMAGLPALPGATGGRGGGGGRGYQRIDAPTDASLFDGIDTRLAGIARFAGPYPPSELRDALSEISDAAVKAQKAFASGDDAGTAAPVEDGLLKVRALRARLAKIALSPSAFYEIDFRLQQKERDFEDAVLAAHGLTFEAIADDGLVVAGQPVKLSLIAINRGATQVGIAAEAVGFDSPAACKPGEAKKDAVYSCSSEAKIPKDATPTTPYFSDKYWKHPASAAINEFAPGVEFGVPFAPTPFRAVFHIKAGSVEIAKQVPVQYRYIKDVYTGEKRMELNVVPALSVRLTPALAVFPAGSKAAREAFVTVTNGTKGKIYASVRLDLPTGWKATPPAIDLAFEHEDEALPARFEVTPPPNVAPGEYTLRAIATANGANYATGYQEIEYPHTERRQVIKPAEASLKVIDVKMAPNVSVGYIVGAGDQVPQAIEQLGAKLHFIDQDELAWGDLSKYNVILTGVRAYEKRADLRAYNHRLLEYAERGGTVIVQYNKMEFNRSDYGPFPAKVSGNRICDETVPVKILVPADAVFNKPNKIGDAAWANWVQERGLYFLGEKDKRYVDLIAMTDSFPDNPGEKLGSFVEAKTGKGRWFYLGLGLWRQLPAGTDGAYQLLANLLSLR